MYVRAHMQSLKDNFAGEMLLVTLLLSDQSLLVLRNVTSLQYSVKLQANRQALNWPPAWRGRESSIASKEGLRLFLVMCVKSQVLIFKCVHIY